MGDRRRRVRGDGHRVVRLDRAVSTRLNLRELPWTSRTVCVASDFVIPVKAGIQFLINLLLGQNLISCGATLNTPHAITAQGPAGQWCTGRA